MATDQERPTAAFTLDIQKLHSLPSEQQDLFLLRFTSDLARHVTKLDPDGATAQQADIKKQLLDIINLSSPAPTRVIRNNLGTCFAGVFGKGNRKLLYESINDLVAILNAGKEKDVKAKHAAVHCLGTLMQAAGDSAVSLSGNTCASIIKLLKTAATHAGLRAAVYKALGRVIQGIGASVDDSTAREIWKSARSAASGDKAYICQISACWCLEQLVKHTPFYDNSNEFEKLQSALWKATDSPSRPVRHAAASCLATTLVKSFSESAKDVVPKVKKPQKARKQAKDDDQDDEPIERIASPSLQRPATALSYGLVDILRLLSTQYTKSSSSNRTRAAIVICLRRILLSVGENVLEEQYGTIAKHLFTELLEHPSLPHNRYRMLMTRKYCRVILQDVVGGMLGETAQLNAARYLVNDILKDYPQILKERPEPSKQALTAALSALTSTIERLNAAIHPLAESCREALLQVLQHPSYTVQLYVAQCLRAFVTAAPSQLLPTISLCMNSVSREIGFLSGPRQGPRRCVGFANGLAALLNASSRIPLYGSIDVYARVLDEATKLLKSSSSSNLRISGTQVQVAWIMIGGLMSLGPSFIKIHLSQLILLWKNAQPPAPTKEELAKRSLLELSFLTQVRECALGSLSAFLHFNARLITSDVAKRIASMLQNSAGFVSNLPPKRTSDDMSTRLLPALQLGDLEIMVRRRIFQCFTTLLVSNTNTATEIVQQSSIMSLAVSSFADPESYTPSSLSVSIASSAGSYDSIWDIGDNSGYGVNGMVVGYELHTASFEKRDAHDRHWTTRNDPEAVVERTLRTPVGEALEHDSISNYMPSSRSIDAQPQPPATELVNSAIGAFALAFPLQSPKLQGSIMEQLSTFVLSSTGSNKDAARKMAITINVAAALLLMVKVLHGQTAGLSGTFQSATAEKHVQSLLHNLIVDPDDFVRYAAAEALGRLCSICGTDMTNNEVKQLIELVVANREPHARAGCSLALSSIHAQLGGMAASYHLKNIVGILMSLAADEHPIVHFWALESLSKVADSAGLTFSGLVSGSIGLLGQLYVYDSHNAETAPQVSSNIEMSLDTVAVLARCVDSIINVLGPDLADMSKPRDMISTLVQQLQGEEDTIVLVQSTHCLEHFAVYAPGHMEFTEYIRRLQADLDSPDLEVKNLAIAGLASIMRRNTQDILSAANPGLEDKLWDLLDDQSDHSMIEGIFNNWLQQTGLTDTNSWVQRCNKLLTKTKARVSNALPTAKAAKQSAGPEIQDEEVAGFAAAAGVKEDESTAPNSSSELVKWQVRLFAMDLLTGLLAMVNKDVAVDDDSAAQASLQQNIADVVKVAFSASTASVIDLRIRGLRILDQILKMFGSTPDPDFLEAMLLEQYQAQISSALTPAFAADSSPELAAEAVNVCATFISTGIVTNVDRMGRIHKVLVSALESFSTPSESASIGDLKGLTSNAQVMVRMAVFSAWAGLQIATAEQKYLVEVVQPYVGTLTPLWLSSLREYAQLRFEPDISSTSSAAMISQTPDTMYAALNRETLLGFYQDAWLKLVDAIASLIDEDSEVVFDALDGKPDQSTTNGTAPSKGENINYREEPAAFFFVLFGLAFEALASRSSGDEYASSSRRLEILQALKKILQPSVAGNAIYQEVIFSETMDLLDRMVLTEAMEIQIVIVEIARNLCLVHPSSRAGQGKAYDEENLSDDIDQLFELTRIIVLVLAGLIPGLAESNRPTRAEISDEAVTLTRLSLDALVDVAEVFPSIIRGDLHSCIFHLFTTILGTGSCQTTIVPQALPIFRRFVNSIAPGARSETRTQIRNTLGRFSVILKNAQRRENEASLPCEKNTILASTILLTTAHTAFPPNDPTVLALVSEFSDALVNPMTTKMASGCARSLLLIPTQSPAQQSITAHLVPRLISFLLCPTTESDQDPSTDTILQESKSLITQSLVNLATTSTALPKPPLFSLVISTLLTRVRDEDGREVFTASKLLELAGNDAATFRSVVLKMDGEQRGLMERLLRENGAGQKRVVRDDEEEKGGEPSIALKFDF